MKAFVHILGRRKQLGQEVTAHSVRRRGLRLLGLAVLAAVAAVAALPGSAQPAFSGQNGKIAFTRYEHDGTRYVAVANADGSGVAQLTDDALYAHDPAWSPDGQKLAFVGWQPGTPFQIYVMNADGSGPTRLTNTAGHSAAPAWSPDGQKIAFASVTDSGTYQIFVMNADGSGQTRLTNVLAHDVDPAWSPDGQKIAFASSRDGGYNRIFVMNADGSGQTRLTSNHSGHDTNPTWSPDGSRLAFGSNRDFDLELYAMNADGSNVTRLTNNLGSDTDPAWSPDGSRIAFASTGRVFGTGIYAMNADGSGDPLPITASLSGGYQDWDVDWQPLVVQAPDETVVATVQPPLKADGSSVFNAGSGVVPVKFTLAVDGFVTCALPPAMLVLTSLSGGGLAAEADFRVDDCQYVYNLNLRSLSPGTYQAEIRIDGQTVGSVIFELR